MTRAPWLDRPWRVAGLVGLLALAYVLLRWRVAADGDLSRFVLVGRAGSVAPGPKGVHIFAGAGYDGQYYYRFALSPGRLGGVVNGIQVDTGLRRQRILYPLLAWLVSGGDGRLVPAALVIVNVVAVVAVAGLGAQLSRAHGRHAAWGLAFAGYAGFVSSLGRDLTELTSAALLLAALLALSRGRILLAALALSLGVLARETVLAVAVGLALWRLWAVVRGRSRPGHADLAWLVPLVAFGAWQAVVALRYGAAPLRAERGNAGWPGAAAIRAVGHTLAHPNLTNLIFLGGVLSLGLLAVSVFAGVRGAQPRPPGYLWLSLALVSVLALVLSKDVWNHDPHELRTFAEVHLLGLATLLHLRRRRLLLVYLALAVPTFVAFASYTISTV